MDAIDFCLNRAATDDIATHLAACDAHFVPPLSQRVAIRDYAERLANFATRFEAWAGPELVGLVAAYFNRPETRTVFISSVSVLPDRQGQRIGFRLMDLCLGHATGLGFTQVTLRVAKLNQIARQLYAKHGFRPGQSEEQDLTMIRELPTVNGRHPPSRPTRP